MNRSSIQVSGRVGLASALLIFCFALTTAIGGDDAHALPPPFARIEAGVSPNGTVWVSWSGATVGAVMRKLSEVTGIPIEVGPGLDDLLFTRWDPGKDQATDVESVIVGVAEMAGSLERKLEVHPFRLGRPGARRLIGASVILRGAPRILEENATEVLKGLEQRAAQLREQVASFTPGTDPFGKILSQFLAKSRITSSLSHQRVTTLEEKRTVWLALNDPRFSSIREALSTAFLHAVQALPEKVDTERILDAMRTGTMTYDRHLTRGGVWYFDALPELWDDRYLPYLREGIRSESYGWIRAAGESGRAAAALVPELEGCLDSNDGVARRAAAEALQAITGKERPIPPSLVQQWPFAEAVRRTRDPKIPREEQLAIAAELREYEFRPEDKDALVEAILVLAGHIPQNRRINGGDPPGELELLSAQHGSAIAPWDLDHAFISAFRDQATPEDDGRILALLEGGSDRPYLVIPDSSWDDRFIPFIVRDVGIPKVQEKAIQVCMRRRLEACLPSLKAALGGPKRKLAESAIAEISGRSEVER